MLNFHSSTSLSSAPLAAIIAVLLVIVPVAIAVLFSTIIIVGCFVYKRRKKGRADITPADDRSPRPIHSKFTTVEKPFLTVIGNTHSIGTCCYEEGV